MTNCAFHRITIRKKIFGLFLVFLGLICSGCVTSYHCPQCGYYLLQPNVYGSSNKCPRCGEETLTGHARRIGPR